MHKDTKQLRRYGILFKAREVWRKLGELDQTVHVEAGSCLTIPTGTHFQFKNTGEEPLCFIIATMPTWPCSDEAVRLQDHWSI